MKTQRVPTVLVAGGFADTRSRLRDWVEHEFPGCQALAAEAADEVREVIGKGGLAVALVDVDLPGRRGIELLRLLRTLAPGVAPIALSAYHAEGYRYYAMGAGAVACVSPQVPDDELKSLVGSLLCTAAGSGAP